MARFHMHVAVQDLEQSVRFYSAVFGSEPTVRKADYAKWQLEDPPVNFAVSMRGRSPGMDHVGIQVESDAELAGVRARLDAAGLVGLAQENTGCCYARSNKHWVVDPQGIAWEAFHTLESTPIFGEADEVAQPGKACCTPDSLTCC